MISTTAKEHRDFFRKHGTIEFSDVIDETQIKRLNDEIDTILLARGRKKEAPKGTPAAFIPYINGHDLWRESAEVKRLVCQKGLARIASELLDTSPLRLAYDQLLPACDGYPWQEPLIEEASSVQGTLGGVVIALSGNSSNESDSPFSGVAGNAVFFQSSFPLPFSLLSELAPQRFLMIVYAEERSVYVLNEADPHAHFLKHLGYVFGDRLKEPLNPLVNRR